MHKRVRVSIFAPAKFWRLNNYCGLNLVTGRKEKNLTNENCGEKNEKKNMGRKDNEGGHQFSWICRCLLKILNFGSNLLIKSQMWN